MRREPIQIGEKVERLTVIEFLRLNDRRARVFKCQCECGSFVEVEGRELRRRGVTSCGCIRGLSRQTHGESRHGHVTPTYRSYTGMLTRCYRVGATDYEIYGGRGIEVCERWRQSFENFKQDMGARPEGTTLDRIDPNGHYEPGNCRWASNVEQGNNRRTNRMLEHEGRRYTVTELARLVGMSPALLFKRISAGWDLDRALKLPSRALERTKNGN